MTALLTTILLIAELTGIVVVMYVRPAHEMLWVAGIAAAGVATALVQYILAIRPIRTLTKGADLLLAQDFGSRLRHTGYGEVDKLARMFNEMMDRLYRERMTVRETNQYLDLLVDSSPMGVLNFDLDDRLTDANPSGLRMLGVNDLDELKGLDIDKLPGYIGQAIGKLQPDEEMTLNARPDMGDDNIYRLSRVIYMDRGFRRTSILIEQLTEVIRQTERAAYDKLIRVMAHEINNAMGAVTSTFDLLADTPEIADDRDLVELVRSCNHRCQSLCRFIERYAAVARLPKPQLSETDITELAERLKPVLTSTATANCRGCEFIITYTPDKRALMVAADMPQLEQVLVNIVKNASESIDRTVNGTGQIELTIDTDLKKITVADTGAGISADTAKKLFTPFFTTKRHDSSGGTGLTLVADILRAHGFGFTLKTDPEDGKTRFEIYLNQTLKRKCMMSPS